MFATDYVGWLIASSPVLVAVFGGAIAAMVKHFERRNDQQHAENLTVLTQIKDAVDHVSERLDGHLEWHAEAKGSNQ